MTIILFLILCVQVIIYRSAEKELLPYATDNNISFVQFFPLVAGLLTGKYSKDARV
ncbi:aldo/keto reductase [Oceanobacillus alkalisoli]|uniref:aldo/keto reductase n=1 Tax=Oceanobacillus alkalisoli TaxID=2925113 RepID=UPI003F689E9E